MSKIISDQDWEKILKIAKEAKFCPDCDNVGWYVIADRNEDPEQRQCQWCYETQNSFFNLIQEILAIKPLALEEESKLKHLRDLVLDDVPHTYQKRLLEFINENI